MSSTFVLSCPVPGMDAALGVVAARSYRIVPGGRAAPLPDPVELPREPVYTESANRGAGFRFLADAAQMELGKPLTDVLLFGHAYVPGQGHATSVETGLEVGAARKSVRAIGPRRIEVTAAGLKLTEPEPFQKVPLTADLAYGGRDRYAEKLLYSRTGTRKPREMELAPPFQLLYPRNAAGRGYFIDMDRDRIHGAPAPCLEDPTDPITADRLLSKSATDWIDRPVAASYEPIDIVTFPRCCHFIRPAFDEPKRTVHELSTGAVLREDLHKPLDLKAPRNPRVFNCAPSGLSMSRLGGGERVKLWNLHRSRSALELDLPDDEPRLLIDVPGVGERAVEARLGTIRIEPDSDRVTLFWSGFMQVAAIYPNELTVTIRSVAVWRRSGASG